MAKSHYDDDWIHCKHTKDESENQRLHDVHFIDLGDEKLMLCAICYAAVQYSILKTLTTLKMDVKGRL